MSWPRFNGRWMMLGLVGVALSLWLILIVRGAKDDALTRECSSNMDQVGKCVLQIALSDGRIPAGAAPQAGAKLEDRWSWIVRTEPYYYQSENQVIDAAGNHVPSFRGKFGMFLCPANPNRTLPNGDGLTHFVGIAGLGVDSPTLPLGNPRVGIFGDDRRIKLADITDGLANTMMIAETCRSNGARVFGGPGTVRGLDPARQPYIDRQFGGTHPGGANVAFADGSVRFIKDSVSPKVFEAMSTIAGGD